MVTRDTAWPAGTPCWVDLGVDDIGKARAFYASLFGWDIPAGGPEVGGYSVCHSGKKMVAGVGPRQEGSPVAWTTYISTEDANATAAKIKTAGGSVLVEPMDVMELGRMVMAVDPGGAVFGVWQAGQHTGFERANEPVSVTWNENWSRDFDRNKAFYAAVFGYTFGDIHTEQVRYATLDLAGRPAGGIGDLGSNFPAETPANWTTYFAVEDTDATAAKVIHLGGRVVAPPMDTPYGRMATVADDQGAVFAVSSGMPQA